MFLIKPFVGKRSDIREKQKKRNPSEKRQQWESISNFCLLSGRRVSHCLSLTLEYFAGEYSFLSFPAYSLLLSFQIDFNQFNAAVVCACLERISGVERGPPGDRKETQTAVVWPRLPFIRSGQNHLARHGEREKKTRQTEEKVGRQHQGMGRPGVRQVSEGSGEQGKMEETGCGIICGAPATLAVKG